MCVKTLTIGLLIGGMIAPLAYGGTMLQGRDDEGGVTVIKIEGRQARIETGDDSGYMLIHMGAGKVYSVNNEQRMVLDVSSAPPTPPGTPDNTQTAPTVTKVGQGPEIAGYPTVQYRVKVGAARCFDDYLAPKALHNEEIRRFVQAMADWTARLHNTGAADEDECDAAADALNQRYPRLGIPLRTVDAAGTVIHEITRIQTGTTYPSDIFELPRGYQVLTQQELMTRMKKMQNEDDTQAPGQFDEMQEDTQDMLQRLLEQE